MNAKANESSFIETLSTQVLTQLAIGVILTNEEGRIVWCNERQQWISGVAAAVLTDQSFFDQPSFTQLGLARVVARVLKSGEPHYHFVTHEGIFCRTEVLPLRINERLSGAAVLFYDREGEGVQKLERLKAQGLLRDDSDASLHPAQYYKFEMAEQRALLCLLTQALDTLPFPVVIFDPSLHVLYINTPFKNSCVSDKKVLGKPVVDLIPAPDRELFRNKAKTYFNNPAKKMKETQGADNLVLPQAVYFFSKLDERTGMDAVVAVKVPAGHMDSHDERDAFTDKFETLCRFTGRLVHDIRNPLTALICQLDFLRNEDLYEEGGSHKFQKGIDLIQQQVDDIYGVLANVESFGEGEGDEPTESPLTDLLLNARVVAELKRPHKSVHIQADMDEGLPSLTCEALRLQKAIVEVLLNALEAAGERGRVRMSARYLQPEDAFEIRILDNGPGIPDNLIDRIFDPFFSTKKRHGAGLGLTVAYAAIRQHSGTISVQTAPGQGTEVVIRLPRQNLTKK
ncbi:hypothetical protein JXO59_01085 [candidate division KSB1 bacterium]|nr:hypothetical protein [candidate division KSB1 bacterium]